MTKTTENLIKTYPVHIDFVWTENKGLSFETRVLSLIKCCLLGLRGNGSIISFNKRLFLETTYNKLSFKSELYLFFRKPKSLKIIFKNNVLLLNDIWTTGPYHFYVDFLSKLHYLKFSLETEFKNKTIYLYDNNFTHNVILPILDDLNFKFKSIHLIDSSKNYLLLGNNSFVTKPHFMGSCNPDVMFKLSELIQFNLTSKMDSKKFIKKQMDYEKVYYYRRDQKRVVINDHDIIPILESMGFYCTTFGDLSYLESFQIMNKAKLLVGIHGGGLTNMIFMKPGRKVIEIKTNNDNPDSQCYFELASSLGFDYTMYVAQQIGKSSKIEGNGCDVILDAKVFLNFIKSVY